MHPGRWWHRLDDGRIQCDLCPRDCRLHDGQRGMCFELIRRDWYEVLECALDQHACCPHCGARVAGRFGPIGPAFGRRRIPVRLEAASEP